MAHGQELIQDIQQPFHSHDPLSGQIEFGREKLNAYFFGIIQLLGIERFEWRRSQKLLGTVCVSNIRSPAVSCKDFETTVPSVMSLLLS